jgi:Surfeit locus protein 6
MAKLDPDNAKTAKDVMDERAAIALKRKREEDGEDTHDGPIEKQREGLKLHDRQEKRRKREQNLSRDAHGAEGTSEETDVKDHAGQEAAKKIVKRERKQAKKLKARQKSDRLKAKKKLAHSNESAPESVEIGKNLRDGKDENESSNAAKIEEKQMDADEVDHASTASSSSRAMSPIQSPPLHSGTSSMSSVQTQSLLPEDQLPTTNSSTGTKSEQTVPPTATDLKTLTPQQRLEARINALRAERKADVQDGCPPRNRQELLEFHRRKEEKRRAQKKELHRLAKEEETRKQEAEIAKRFSPGGSGSSLIGSPRSPMPAEPGGTTTNNSFTFGRLAFSDGSHADPSLSTLLSPHQKRKGPSDPTTALQAAQNKATRLSGLSGPQRASIEQKDMWLNAKRRAHGDRDENTTLLRKALQRQQSSKKKSEREWSARLDAVAQSQEARQKRRAENIAKRRHDAAAHMNPKSKPNSNKKNKNKNKPTMMGGGGGSGRGGQTSKIKRPGFEGSFKTKSSSTTTTRSTSGGGGGGGKRLGK